MTNTVENSFESEYITTSVATRTINAPSTAPPRSSAARVARSSDPFCVRQSLN